MTPIEKAAKLQFEAGTSFERWEDLEPGVVMTVHVNGVRKIITAFLNAILADEAAMQRVCEYVITSVGDYAEATIEALKEEVGR